MLNLVFFGRVVVSLITGNPSLSDQVSTDANS